MVLAHSFHVLSHLLSSIPNTLSSLHSMHYFSQSNTTQHTQILTQEDWNVVLFNAMERTNHWSAIYFVVLMTFGNYVLFNLLVAILVEGFSTQEDRPSHTSESEGSGEVKDPNLIYFYGHKDSIDQGL